MASQPVSQPKSPPPSPPQPPMQTALFIRRNPPPLTVHPPRPFAEELTAAGRAFSAGNDNITDGPSAGTDGVQGDAKQNDIIPASTSTSASLSSSSSSSSTPRVSFSSLPAELREAIWTACLPRRVISLCPHPDDVAESVDYSAGSRMPQPMASVCYESRAVVSRNGRWTIGAGGVPVWFDPKRDTILINSRQPVDYFLLWRETLGRDHEGRAVRTHAPEGPHGAAEPAPSPAEEEAAAEGPITVGELSRHQLVGCLDEAVRGGGGIAIEYELLRSRVGRVVFPLLAECAKIATASFPSSSSSPPTPLVYFDEVTVTGTRAQALASGLFGAASSPEEQMFFVPLSDRATLQRIQALSKAHPLTDRQRNGGTGGLGGLRVGNAGFIRELLRPSHSVQNLHMLAIHYLTHNDRWHRDYASELPDVLIARALEAGMPSLEQAVLFRFREAPEDGGGR